MAARSCSLTFVSRTGQPGISEVRLLVLDERTNDVVTDLRMTPQQYADLAATRVIRIEEDVHG